jgi:hypothetical protein
MRRRRELAAAPQRTTGETWETLAGMVREALVCSASVDHAEVDAALAAARPAGLALIAAGHLDAHPLVLVGPPVHLSITTISGDGALGLQENLTVPGGTSIEEWTLHLPTPDPVGALVRAAAATHERLSSDEPPADVEESTSAASVLDRGAFANRGNGQG